MNKNKKGLIAIGVIVVLGIVIWQVTKKPKEKTKKDYVDNIYNTVIDNRSIEMYNDIMGRDLAYLKAWSDAVDAKVNTFKYLDKNYLTSSGTVQYIK